MTHADIRALIDTVERMQEAEQYQVFDLLKQETNKYTENQNGVFVNLSHVEEATLRKIATFVKYWEMQRVEIAEKEAASKALAAELGTTGHPATIAANTEMAPRPCGETCDDTGGTRVSERFTATYKPESTVVDTDLTESEREQVKVHLENRRISLNKGKKHRFEGSAARVARKCMHTDDDS